MQWLHVRIKRSKLFPNVASPCSYYLLSYLMISVCLSLIHSLVGLSLSSSCQPFYLLHSHGFCPYFSNLNFFTFSCTIFIRLSLHLCLYVASLPSLFSKHWSILLRLVFSLFSLVPVSVRHYIEFRYNYVYDNPCTSLNVSPLSGTDNGRF